MEKLSPFRYNYLHSIYLAVQNLKLVFVGKKTWRNALALKSKNVQVTFWETFILTLSSWFYRFQQSFFYETASRISLNLFCLGDKRLLSNFMRKWGWFRSFIKRQTSGTSSDNESQWVIQRVTENNNEWQRMTKSDKE